VPSRGKANQGVENVPRFRITNFTERRFDELLRGYLVDSKLKGSVSRRIGNGDGVALSICQMSSILYKKKKQNERELKEKNPRVSLYPSGDKRKQRRLGAGSLKNVSVNGIAT